MFKDTKMKYLNTANKVSPREQKGIHISKLNGIKRIDQHSYKAKSQSSEIEYDILDTELGFICSCRDHVYRGVKCKHIYAVEFSLELRKTVESSIVIQPLDTLGYQFCSSKRFVKDAIDITNMVMFNVIFVRIAGRDFQLT
jgi:hypothetical protein